MGNDGVVGAGASVGQFRTFSEAGPTYEIMSMRESATSTLAHVRVLHTGEELDYPWEEASSDPLAP